MKRGAAAMGTWALLVAPVWAAAPRPSSSAFFSADHALMLRPPEGATTCPLPQSGAGADHGAAFVLVSPGDCAAESAPRIAVFYALAGADPPVVRPECVRRVGRIVLLGKPRALCRTLRGSMLEISASADYAGAKAWVRVSLWTTPDRLKADMQVMGRLAASVRAMPKVLVEDRNRGRRGGSQALSGGATAA